MRSTIFLSLLYRKIASLALLKLSVKIRMRASTESLCKCKTGKTKKTITASWEITKRVQIPGDDTPVGRTVPSHCGRWFLVGSVALSPRSLQHQSPRSKWQVTRLGRTLIPSSPSDAHSSPSSPAFSRISFDEMSPFDATAASWYHTTTMWLKGDVGWNDYGLDVNMFGQGRGRVYLRHLCVECVFWVGKWRAKYRFSPQISYLSQRWRVGLC